MKVSGTLSRRVNRSPLLCSPRGVPGACLISIACLTSIALSACSSSDSDSDKRAAQCDAEVEKSLDGLPDSLTCTGLYRDFRKKKMARQMREYAPAFRLWSDGADKRRWMALPEDTTIDATSNSEWRFPIGTKFFKEFSVDGRRIETRLFQKTRGDHWARASYAWNEDETDAVRSKGGDLPDVKINGATYRIPSGRECDQCHEGKNDRILGFDAVSLGLAGAEGVSLQDLVDEDLIKPAPKRTSLEIGDDGTKHAAAVLGWLNINCGMPCHNDNSNSEGYSSRLRLQLDPDQLDGRPANEFKSIKTTVGIAGETLRWSEETRIVPGSPDRSLLYKLVTSRAGKNDQMPPIASRVVDEEATAEIKAWISAMTGRAADEVPERDPGEPDADPVPEAEPEAVPESEAAPEAEPEAQPSAQPDAQPESEAPESEAEADPVSDVDSSQQPSSSDGTTSGSGANADAEGSADAGEPSVDAGVASEHHDHHDHHDESAADQTDEECDDGGDADGDDGER
jgi:hypothetical protein